MRGLKSRTVLVTGGGGGIGSATCRRFAGEGARVIVCDIDAPAAERVVASVRDGGGDAMPMIADLTDHVAITTAVAQAEKEFGPIDILVNNAGWDRFVPFLESDPSFWNKIIDINLRGCLNVTHPVLTSMVRRGVAGRIVSISSDAGRCGSSGEAVYSACKAGIIALMKTLAREHARNGITCNTVCPGVTQTGLLDALIESAGNREKLLAAYTRAVPMGRLGQPDDLPGAILFLASDDAAFITGQVLSVSGGLTMNG